MNSTISSSTASAPDHAIARDAHTGARLGLLSAAAWIVLGIDSIVRPVQDNRREVFWWLPSILMMLTIIYVHRVQRSQGLRLERYTFYVVMIAWLLVIIGNLGLVFNIPALASLGFPGGAVVGTLGLIAFGAGTWRAEALPRYASLGLILWEPGSIATGLLLSPISPLRDRGSYSAGIWKGLAIGAVALGMQDLSRRLRSDG